MPIDYGAESQQLGPGFKGEILPWFNPGVGSHRIKIMGEGEEYATMYRNQRIEKVRFPIECNGEKYNWGVNKGKTTSSLWGQLVVCGKAWGGLQDKTVSLVVKTTTRRDGSTIREFTVLEAVNLMAEQGQQQPQPQAQAPGQPQQPVQPVQAGQPSQPVPATQQSGQAPTLQDKIATIKGQSMSKSAIIQSLGIDENKLNNLVELGMIKKQGDNFLVQ